MRKLRNGSHPNPKLQSAYRKYGELLVSILREGTEGECVAYEAALRPSPNVAWNIMVGGNIPPSQKGRKWFTDGVKSVVALVCPDGFVPGRTQSAGEAHALFGKPKGYKISYSKEFLARQRTPPPSSAFSESAIKKRADKMRGRPWSKARRAAQEARA